jgi:tRNA-2-methylthio-N6-dimethylallyladenosine synthase
MVGKREEVLNLKMRAFILVLGWISVSMGYRGLGNSRLAHFSSRSSDMASQAQTSENVNADSDEGTHAPTMGPKYTVPSLEGAKYKINEVVPVGNIENLRYRHIEVATEAVAEEVRGMLTKGAMDFGALAAAMSLNEDTKHHGGDVGWLSVTGAGDYSEGGTRAREEYDPSVAALVNAALFMNKGDLKIVNTGKSSYHILQLLDVRSKLSPELQKRQKDRFRALQGGKDGDKFTYSMETMGCQMNVADSERIQGQLDLLGYDNIDDSSKANIVVLNTCSIRDHAEQKVYSYVGPHALRKRKGEDVAIIVAGCVAQQEGKKLLRRFPEIDVIMGPQYANRFSDILESAIDGNQVVATDPSYQTEDITPSHRRSDVTAYVNVIYGCNERCTYCVVPTTRGVEQSRTKDAIVAEIAALVQSGYREVTLLGQNIDSWGRDFSPMQRFADLLQAVGEVEGIERVRFLTSHPKYMSKRVVSVVAANPKLMPNFNVPFQSGNDEVLRNMRRGYSRKRFLDIVHTIRQQVPDAAITADCIVGFPGETEEQFCDTLSLMEEVRFDLVNTAAYSPRPNTPAADWTDQVSEEEKQERLQRINRLATQHALERSERFVGCTMDVLVEEVNMKRPSQVVGRNGQNRLVFFDGEIAELKGKIVPVKITEARSYSLTGIQAGGEPR